MGMENLVRVFNQSATHERRDGTAAYRTYHAIISDVARRHGFSTRVGAAVFSALSPNNSYLDNLRDADRLLAAAAAQETIESFKVRTYGQNKRKAWAIAMGAEPLDLIVAPKTRNFFLNVNDPDDRDPVTIDGHMLNVWNGERRPLASSDPSLRISGLRGEKYEEIADGFRDLAQALGLIPCELQAILWLTWRRMHGVTKPQFHLWDVEREVAGLGFVLTST